jgi:hypothetical protein
MMFGIRCFTQMQIPTRRKIRARKIGSNVLSDKYILPVLVEHAFQDLALFIAHTGFANVRQKQRRSDVDILPMFRSVVELEHFIRQTTSTDEITCGFTFQSLDMAWQIFQQNTMAQGNTLWYIADEFRFILYIQNEISKSTCDVLTDSDLDPALGPMHSTFRPDVIEISIDSFISTQIIQHIRKSAITTQHLSGDVVYAMTKTMVSSACIYNAISIMYPRYMKRHGLSINSIANRLSKYRHNFRVSLGVPTIV